MKHLYIIETMTEDNYCRYMSGSNNYFVNEMKIWAYTPEYALKLATNRADRVNEHSIKQVR